MHTKCEYKLFEHESSPPIQNSCARKILKHPQEFQYIKFSFFRLYYKGYGRLMGIRNEWGLTICQIITNRDQRRILGTPLGSGQNLPCLFKRILTYNKIAVKGAAGALNPINPNKLLILHALYYSRLQIDAMICLPDQLISPNLSLSHKKES